jgi:hypothetical protein
LHNATVACQGCGKEFSYQTMFMETVGVAVCPYCGVRDGAVTPRDEPASPLDMEGQGFNGLSGSAGSRMGAST